LTAAAHRPLRRVRLIVFPGGFNWPIWVAEEHGWFATEGIELEVTSTPGSVFQLTGLIEGRFDIAITLIDNVIAYREEQGEVPTGGADLFAFMAADTRVFPTLVTLPEISGYADLRGRTLSVDALNTGYALVLRAMLEHGGLRAGDYRLERVGGARERYRALAERKHAGCLLNSPFEALLQARGFNVLDTAIAVLGCYQGQVAAARRSWAEANRDVLVGVIGAFLRAVEWLYDQTHRERAFQIYCEHTPDADASAAATAYAVLFDPAKGFPRNGAVDLEAIDTVIALRSKYGRPERTLGVPSDYYDPSFLAEAIEGAQS
jgi:ABC-type nitrate/sulfonate/bicarbonate transport system substrate-binding protein